MIRLPIQSDYFFHFFCFCCIPDTGGEAVGAGHDQHAGFYFKDVGVPELALGRGKSFVEGAGDHIFDADKAGVGGGSVVDQALADVW